MAIIPRRAAMIQESAATVRMKNWSQILESALSATMNMVSRPSIANAIPAHVVNFSV